MSVMTARFASFAFAFAFVVFVAPALAQPSCIGDCDLSGEVTVDEIVTLVNLALNGGVEGCAAGDGNSDGSITVEEVVAAVNNALSGCPTLGEGLGVRRFSLSSESRLELLGLPIVLSTNDFTGFFDLEAGPADSAGVRPLHLTAASEFVQIVLTPPIGGPVVICVQPLVEAFPLQGIGTLACQSSNFGGLELIQDHNITDTDPTCESGTPDTNPFHPGVCNGPTIANLVPGSTGPGAASIAPAPDSMLGGLPVSITIEAAAPCGDEGVEPIEAPFALNTVLGRATVLNAGNIAGNTLTAERTGVNFDCANWTQEDGPGTFVLVVPLVDFDTGVLGMVDGAISFQLTD